MVITNAKQRKLAGAKQRRDDEVGHRVAGLIRVAEIEGEHPFDRGKYWVISGLSTPSFWLIAHTSSSAANAPSTLRPTLPGSTLTIMNTMVASNHKVITVDANRRRRNLRTLTPNYVRLQPPTIRLCPWTRT